MNNSQDLPSRRPSFVGMPRSRLGLWSVGLAVLFLGLFVTWLLYVQARPIDRPTFFSDPLHAVLYIGATVAAITGAIAGVLAFVLTCLAAVAGYIRADEATWGYYTNTLRVVAVGAVGATGALIYLALA